LAEKQAEKYQLVAVTEKVERDQQEQLAELVWVNNKVSSCFGIWYLTLTTWSGLCEGTGHEAGGMSF